MDITQIIDKFLEENQDLWNYGLADYNELKLELALEDYLLAYGIEFSTIDVIVTEDEIQINVYGEPVDYLSITKEVIKGV